jgi:inner membrane protein involved in colicin E2 resistance
MTSLHRIGAIILTLVAATLSWQVLDVTTGRRTDSQHGRLGQDIRTLWGSSQTQVGPQFTFEWETQREEIREEAEEGGKKKRVSKQVTDRHERQVAAERTDIDVDLGLDQRRRGLMWYSLYGVTFVGRWSYRHEGSESGTVAIAYRFPVAGAIYDDFRFVVNGRDLGRDVKPENGNVLARFTVRTGQVIDFRVHYRTRGMTSWSYQPQGAGVANLRNFTLRLRCDFHDIDYPATSLAPSQREQNARGWALTWRFAQVLTGQEMGLVMPARIQPGELASALARSAPVSLLFFFLVVFSLAVLRGLDIHPVNYLGIAAAFFAFHLLFAYSVDHLSIGVAFTLASLVSVVLCASYLRLVVSPVFAYREAAFCQLVYQVGFSAAHFLPGYTGLTVTVLAILTLFILMQLTGRVRWSAVFARRDATATAAPRTVA